MGRYFVVYFHYVFSSEKKIRGATRHSADPVYRHTSGYVKHETFFAKLTDERFSVFRNCVAIARTRMCTYECTQTRAHTRIAVIENKISQVVAERGSLVVRPMHHCAQFI